MKRIVICCDGTWNRSDAPNPTNVVQIAQSVSSFAKKGSKTIPQLVFYLDGVGSGRGAGRIGRWLERQLGGIFGWRLLENIKDAYRALIFNYEPGDEIYIFGFSRGAYTARSLAGLLRKSGILPAGRVNEIDDAIALYRKSGSLNTPDATHIWQERRRLSPQIATSQTDKDKRGDDSHVLNIAYLGVWDTVGALGVPNFLSHFGLPVQWINAKYNFHDMELSSSVKSARHAVSIDEQRATFPPALWDNLDKDKPDGTLCLNNRFPPLGRAEKKYQQLWFSGDHGSIGGGGDFHGLSNISLAWVGKGAKDVGLTFSDAIDQFDFDNTDVCEPVINVHNIPVSKRLLNLVKRPRNQLQDAQNVSLSTVCRVKLMGYLYRPKTLDPVRRGVIARADDCDLLPPNP